ncbi:MAG: KEOPS complex subunit Cgi121 [Promethearchaeota archaeon]
MIVKKFFIEDLNLKYFAGINQIKFDYKDFLYRNNLNNKVAALNYLFDFIERIQMSYQDSIFQFFNDKYILNQDHLFTSIYFVQKAFKNKINISNKKNIEIFLYLTSKRQIKNGIEIFGLKNDNLKSDILTYCIVSLKNNIEDINNQIIKEFKAKEIDLLINKKSIEKFNIIKEYFSFTENQINVILNSYGFRNMNELLLENDLEKLYLALNELIYERMSLLSLEKN